MSSPNLALQVVVTTPLARMIQGVPPSNPNWPLNGFGASPYQAKIHSALRTKGVQPAQWQVSTCQVVKFVNSFQGNSLFDADAGSGFTEGNKSTGLYPPYAIQTPFKGFYGLAVQPFTSKNDVITKLYGDIFGSVTNTRTGNADPNVNFTETSTVDEWGNVTCNSSNGNISDLDPFPQNPPTWIAGDPLINRFDANNQADQQSRVVAGHIDAGAIYNMAFGVFQTLVAGVNGSVSWDESNGFTGVQSGFTGQQRGLGPAQFNPVGAEGPYVGTICACGISLGPSGGAFVFQKQQTKLIASADETPHPIFIARVRSGLPKTDWIDLLSDIQIQFDFIGIAFVKPGQTIGSDPGNTIVLPFPGPIYPVVGLGTNAVVSDFVVAVPFQQSTFIDTWPALNGSIGGQPAPYTWGQNKVL